MFATAGVVGLPGPVHDRGPLLDLAHQGRVGPDHLVIGPDHLHGFSRLFQGQKLVTQEQLFQHFQGLRVRRPDRPRPLQQHAASVQLSPVEQQLTEPQGITELPRETDAELFQQRNRLLRLAGGAMQLCGRPQFRRIRIRGRFRRFCDEHSLSQPRRVSSTTSRARLAVSPVAQE